MNSRSIQSSECTINCKSLLKYHLVSLNHVSLFLSGWNSKMRRPLPFLPAANFYLKFFNWRGTLCPVSSSSSRGATLKRNEVVLQRVELGPKSSDQKVSGNFQRGERARVITLSSTFSTLQKKFSLRSPFIPNGLNFSWDFQILAMKRSRFLFRSAFEMFRLQFITGCHIGIFDSGERW